MFSPENIQLDPYHPQPEALFGDVPLSRAIISWSEAPPRGTGKVMVVPHPDNSGVAGYYELTHTTGAGWDFWQQLSPTARLGRLFFHFHELTVFHGLVPGAVHEAFWVIPEYREAFTNNIDGLTCDAFRSRLSRRVSLGGHAGV